MPKQMISRTLEEWMSQVMAVSYTTFRIKGEDDQYYLDEEQALDLAQTVALLSLAYHELMESGEKGIETIERTDEVIKQLREQLKKLGNEAVDAIVRTKELYDKLGVKKGKNNGQEDGNSSERPTSSGKGD